MQSGTDISEGAISRAALALSANRRPITLPPVPRTLLHDALERWLKRNHLATTRDFRIEVVVEKLYDLFPVKILPHGEGVTALFSVTDRFRHGWRVSSELIVNRSSPGEPVSAWYGRNCSERPVFMADIPDFVKRLRSGEREGHGSQWSEVSAFPPAFLAPPESAMRWLQGNYEPVHRLLRQYVIYHGRSKEEFTREFLDSAGR